MVLAVVATAAAEAAAEAEAAADAKAQPDASAAAEATAEAKAEANFYPLPPPKCYPVTHYLTAYKPHAQKVRLRAQVREGQVGFLAFFMVNIHACLGVSGCHEDQVNAAVLKYLCVFTSAGTCVQDGVSAGGGASDAAQDPLRDPVHHQAQEGVRAQVRDRRGVQDSG